MNKVILLPVKSLPFQTASSVLIFVIVSVLPGCASTRWDPKSPVATQARSSLGGIHDSFLLRLAKAPSSSATKSGLNAFDARCRYGFQEGSLLRYFNAAVEADAEAVRDHLVEVSAQLDCVSAARFRDVQVTLQAAMAEMASQRTKTSAEVERSAAQVLAPVLLLFFDKGSASLRQQLYPWLFIKLAEFKKDLENPRSIIGHVGLWVPTDYGLAKLKPNEINHLVHSFASNAWLSGRCSTQHIVRIAVRVGGVVVELPYCPRDCAHAETESSDSAKALNVIANGDPIASLKDACRGIRDHAEDLQQASTRGKVKQCMEEFGDRNRAFMSCLVDSSTLPHPLLGFSAEPTPTQDVAIGRNCKLTQDATTSRRGRIETETVITPDADGRGHQWWRRSTHYDTNGDMALTVIVERSFDDDGDIATSHYQVIDHRNNTSTTVETTYNEEGEGKSVVYVTDADGERTDAQPCSGLASCLGEAPAPQDSSQCSPAQDTCADGCSIADQILRDLQECTALIDDGPGEDDIVGPDPRVAMPDPQTVDALASELGGLAQCLVSAFAGEGPDLITQNDCRSYLRCPDQEWPRGENCTCLPQQMTPGGQLTDLCLWIQCDEQSQTCPCAGLGSPGDDTGGTVPQPTPDPTPRLIVFGRVQ